MADNVVSLFDRTPVEASLRETMAADFRANAIEELKHLLEHFEAGDFNGFAIVVSHDDGSVSSVCSDEVAAMPVEYLGGLARLSHRINIEMDFNQGIFDED